MEIFQILYILLIVHSEPTVSYSFSGNNIIEVNGILAIDKEIIIDWSTMYQHGDAISPGRSHYDAILFKTEKALDRYLLQYKADGAILINVKTGKQSTISQKPINKTIQKTVEEFDHYEWKEQ